MRLLLGFSVLAALLVLPLLAPKFEQHQALVEYRELVDASTVKSSHGHTRYQRWGDARKPTVLLIHSFNGYLETWQPNIDALVSAGYHVVAYDLFGRGLSDRPLKPYTLKLFHEQIDTLRAELNLKAPLHLVGASYGCVIASDYALKHPDAVKSLTLTGPAGWPDEQNQGQEIAKTPFLGEYIFFYAGRPLSLNKVSGYVLNQEQNEWIEAYWKVYEQFPGVSRAALSTLRHGPVLDNTNGWKQLGRSDIPVLFIWGRQDSSFPYYHKNLASKLIPQAEIIGVDGAEHWVNVDQPETVNRALVEFIRNQR